MSETKVKLPDLSPTEYTLLVTALRFYHDNAKTLVLDADTDSRERHEWRAEATLSKDLLEKIG